MIGKIVSVIIWPLVWFIAPLRLRASVLLTVNDDVLVVTHTIGSGTWNLPGGGIKRGDSAQETAVREISEELGIIFDVDDTNLLNKEFIAIKHHGVIHRHQFVHVNLHSRPKITKNREISGFNWKNMEDEDFSPQVAAALNIL